MTVTAFVGLGANLGDARLTITDALVSIKRMVGVDSCEAARLYGSEPVDATGPAFINTVVKLTTHLSAIALLDQLQRIETAFGRQRPYPNAPRTLDLDLLWYDGINMDTPRLTLPHPRMHLRAFVLKPLSELAPDLTLPQGSIKELLLTVEAQSIWVLT